MVDDVVLVDSVEENEKRYGMKSDTQGMSFQPTSCSRQLICSAAVDSSTLPSDHRCVDFGNEPFHNCRGVAAGRMRRTTASKMTFGRQLQNTRLLGFLCSLSSVFERSDRAQCQLPCW